MLEKTYTHTSLQFQQHFQYLKWVGFMNLHPDFNFPKLAWMSIFSFLCPLVWTAVLWKFKNRMFALYIDRGQGTWYSLDNTWHLVCDIRNGSHYNLYNNYMKLCVWDRNVLLYLTIDDIHWISLSYVHENHQSVHAFGIGLIPLQNGKMLLDCLNFKFSLKFERII